MKRSLSRRAGWILAIIIMAAATTAHAQAVWHTISIGGDGGVDMGVSDQNMCGENQFLTGLVSVGGKDMNSVAAVCQLFDANGRWNGPDHPLRTWGDPNISNRNALTDVARCPQDTAAARIVVRVGANIVHAAALICRHINAYDYVGTPYANWDSSDSDGVTQRPEAVATCGDQALAVGIVGRYGSMVDSLGLLCRVVATKPVAPPPPPPPPDKPPPNKAPPLVVNNGNGNGDGGGGGDTAVAASGTTIYKQPNGDESEDNQAGFVDPGGTVTIISCDPEAFCHVSAPVDGYVWHEDIGR